MTAADAFTPQDGTEVSLEGDAGTIDQLRGRVMELAIERDVLIAELGEALYEKFKGDPQAREGLESYFEAIDQIDQQGAFISDQIAQLQGASEVPEAAPTSADAAELAPEPEPAPVPVPETAPEPAPAVNAAPVPAAATVSAVEPLDVSASGPICIACGTVLGAQDRFCYECGTPVAPVADAASPGPAPAFLCAACGASMNPGDRFCMACGAPAPADQPAVAPASAEKPAPEPAPAPESVVAPAASEAPAAAMPQALDPDDDITILVQDAQQLYRQASVEPAPEPEQDAASAVDEPSYAQPVDPSEDATVLLQDTVLRQAAEAAEEPDVATPVAFDECEAPTQLLQPVGDDTLGGEPAQDQQEAGEGATRPAFCMNCGTPAGETDIFCGACGTKLS